MNKNYKIKKLRKKDYIKFYNSLKDARNNNSHGIYVLLRDPEVYKYTQNFLMGNAIAGFAIEPNGELISIHKNTTKANSAKVSHVLPLLVKTAFKHGADRGDCYGDFLASYYASCGFLPVAIVPFDSLDDNPATWDTSKFGKPNCYILARAVKNNNELKKLKKSNKLLNLSEIEPYVKRFSNYEDALKYRDNLLTLFKGVNYLTIVDYIKHH